MTSEKMMEAQKLAEEQAKKAADSLAQTKQEAENIAAGTG